MNKAGAIFGILGKANPVEVEQMAGRLGHRGDRFRTWSVNDSIHFGLRYFQNGTDTFELPSRPILFCGFLDNREDLLAMFAQGNPPTFDDADLIYDIYFAAGMQGLRLASGQFSVALWDERSKKLVLSCDSWTSRPLYYTFNEGRCLFASEYKALLAIGSVPAVPDRESIQYIQCTKYVMPGKCCIEGIHALAGGTWIELDNEQKNVHRYQDLEIKVSAKMKETHALTLQRNFIDAVRKQGRPFPRIGVSLSSGLDSTITMAAVRQAYPEREVHAFTAGISEDDGVFENAGRVASYFNATHHKIVFQPGMLPALIPQALWFMEDPVGREEKLFYFITAREAAKHVPVLLAGHNADALYGGMPRHTVVKINNKMPFLRRPIEEFFHYTQLGEAPRTLLGKSLVAAYYRGAQVPPPRVIDAGRLPTGNSIVRQSPQPINEFLKEVQLFSANANLTIEKIHAGNNIIFNSPFLDTDFVRFSFEIPDYLKIYGLKQKYILRRAFETIMPAEMVQRKKGLLRLEHNKFFSEVIYELSQNYLSAASVKNRNLFHPDYVRKMIMMPRKGFYSTEQTYRIWSMLLVEIWARIFIDDRGAPTLATPG